MIGHMLTSQITKLTEALALAERNAAAETHEARERERQRARQRAADAATADLEAWRDRMAGDFPESLLADDRPDRQPGGVW
jgi:hypothetical protein